MTDSEMDYVATGKAVTENYENLLHKYHPALQNVLTATSNLNNSLFELARNQANYIKVTLLTDIIKLKSRKPKIGHSVNIYTVFIN